VQGDLGTAVSPPLVKDRTYVLRLEFTAEAGHIWGSTRPTFSAGADVPEYFIRGIGVTVANLAGTAAHTVAGQGIKTILVTITFERTRETMTAGALIVSGVTAPVTGATPVTLAAVRANTTNAGIEEWEVTDLKWTLEDGTPHEGEFKVGTIYHAVITLTASNLFTFHILGAAAMTVTGANPAEPVAQEASAGVISPRVPAGRTYEITAIFDITS